MRLIAGAQEIPHRHCDDRYNQQQPEEWVREQSPTGLHLGGFGWVENVRPRPAPANQGYVHTPSLDHAVETFATQQQVPDVHSTRDQRKDDVAAG